MMALAGQGGAGRHHTVRALMIAPTTVVREGAGLAFEVGQVLLDRVGILCNAICEAEVSHIICNLMPEPATLARN